LFSKTTPHVDFLKIYCRKTLCRTRWSHNFCLLPILKLCESTFLGASSVEPFYFTLFGRKWLQTASKAAREALPHEACKSSGIFFRERRCNYCTTFLWNYNTYFVLLGYNLSHQLICQLCDAKYNHKFGSNNINFALQNYLLIKILVKLCNVWFCIMISKSLLLAIGSSSSLIWVVAVQKTDVFSHWAIKTGLVLN